MNFSVTAHKFSNSFCFTGKGLVTDPVSIWVAVGGYQLQNLGWNPQAHCSRPSLLPLPRAARKAQKLT